MDARGRPQTSDFRTLQGELLRIGDRWVAFGDAHAVSMRIRAPMTDPSDDAFHHFDQAFRPGVALQPCNTVVHGLHSRIQGVERSEPRHRAAKGFRAFRMDVSSSASRVALSMCHRCRQLQEAKPM